MLRAFVGLPFFERERRRLGLSDGDRRGLEADLLENPKAGPLVADTNGVRKLRRPITGKGKSGGIRVFYYDDGQRFLILFLAVIKKGEQENLSKAERLELGRMVKEEIATKRTRRR